MFFWFQAEAEVPEYQAKRKLLTASFWKIVEGNKNEVETQFYCYTINDLECFF
jgi:hypothetical protein